MVFSQQVYWGDVPFPPPVDHVSSELSAMTHPSWVALLSVIHERDVYTMTKLDLLQEYKVSLTSGNIKLPNSLTSENIKLF